jgi:hypothetical protein
VMMHLGVSTANRVRILTIKFVRIS